MLFFCGAFGKTVRIINNMMAAASVFYDVAATKLAWLFVFFVFATIGFPLFMSTHGQYYFLYCMVGKNSQLHIIIPLCVIALIGGIALLVSKKSTTTSGDALAVQETQYTKGGGEDAPVTLVEFKDFQCPGCAGYAPLVSQLEQEFNGDVRVVFRHFPLTSIHANAIASAKAAEAAGRQEKFWEMHDLLFARQTEWSNVRDPFSLFQQYAEELGLDVARFDGDFNSNDVEDVVRQDLRAAQSLGLTGTPTFFINGEKIDTPPDYASFKSIIEQAILATGADSSLTPAVVPQVKPAN